ncbi:MAG: M16 family metallopeptidase [Dehalococcoidia bacterium]
MTLITPLPTDIMPFTAHETTLGNGLRVIVVPTGFPNLVSLQIPVQTGSRNEVEAGKSGFAHFFEHMMFRGTKRFPPDRYQEIVTRSGARQNAYTTDDYTNYHMTFAKEDLETVLEIEADRFMHLDYSEADFRTEARAILGEYNKSASDPLTKLIEVQRDHAYTTHTYKHTTMGFIADIEAMPEQFAYSRAFLERWYRPEYTTIVLAGDVAPESALALVEKYWGGWGGGATTLTAIPQEPAHEAASAAHVEWPAETLPWVTAGFRGPAFSAAESDYAALDMLFDLFFGETSDVYQDLMERRQLVDQIFPYGGGSQDPGLFTIFARVKRAEDAPAVRDAVVAAIAEARRAPVTPERLAEAKSNARYSFARTLDNSESIASTLARFVRYDRSYSTLNELFRRFDALTPGDLHAAGQRYLRDERMIFTTLSAHALPAGMERPPSIRAVEEAVPAAAAPGFKTILQQTPSPLVRCKLLFRVGSAHDPAGTEGLAALAAEMIASAGSERLRIDEITKALFPIAGSFTARVDKEMTTFSGVTHRDNLDRFLDIALPQLLKPGFREEDFARLKEAQQNELVQDLRSNNEEELGKERLQALLFAGSPYGHPVLGSVGGLSAIILEDVQAFVAANYCQANLVLGLAGDIPAAAKERISRELATLPAGSPAVVPQVTAASVGGISVEVIEKETRSTAISFGHPIAVTRSHPDFAALWLTRAWLGEHRASNGRLFQRLREVRGLNYGNYAYIEAFPGGMYGFFPEPNLARRAQIFEVWIRPVAPEHAVFALKAALYELRKLIREGLTPEAFEATRQYLMKNVFVMTKTQDQQLGYALDSDWYGIGDFVETMRAGLMTLTPDAVNAAIRRHLSGEDLQVVMITKDAAGLREELLSGAFTGMSYESPKADDIVAEDREVGALALGLAAERVRVTKVEDVFA